MSGFYSLEQAPRNILNQAIVRVIVSENNGALFDPSDLSTLYQDADGTTPVTAVEQPVGKMLDKSGNGYHATQSITASRPTLSARYNLLTGTDTFSGWTTGSTSIVSGLLTVTSTNTDGYLRYQTTQLINTKYSTSIEAKQGTTKWLRLRNLAVNNNVKGEAWFDLSSGVLGTVLGSVSASIVDIGSGYFRCSITGSTISTIAANYIDYAPSDSDNTRSVTAGKNLYVRNPSHNIGDLISPYQRVNTATDYDTDERYFPKYLRFDGIDDYLNLPFMNLYGGGAASIIAARNAVSQAADTYIISERSTTNANPKYFPSRQLASGGNMDSYISDDTAAVVLDTIGSAFSGASDKVIRSVVDTGNNIKLFKNGALAANDNYTRTGTLTLNNTTIGVSVSTTTGNYASMKLYGLIITKSALTDAQRVKCERFLAQKSGAML